MHRGLLKGTELLRLVGERCMVGANSLITEGKQIPPDSVFYGAPGKIVGKMTEEAVQGALFSAKHYEDEARRYSANSISCKL
jgi:carbonic anhydrase/acetyltransferase-like protein (isoleucine patch superfamily)